MARLAHELCAGRLHMRLGEQPRQWSDAWEQQVTAYGEAYSRWLAKHARLLAELRLEQVHTSQLHYVAAGLCTAAGMGAAAQRVTRAQAASQSEAMRAAAAGPAPAGPAPASAQEQKLPLRSLLSTGYGDSSGLLDSLAACPQLTQLQLDWCAPARLQDLAAGLAALRGLKDLSLSVKYSTVAVPALPAALGTQLTKLRLGGVTLTAEGMRSLPPSLADLEYRPPQQRAPVDITHLSGLVRLSWQFQQAGDKLPPSPERVHSHFPRALEPLHPLTRLQSLQLGDMRACNLEQLQAAVAAIGPSLTALDVAVGEELGGQLLSQRIAGPLVLPLTGLTNLSGWYRGSVAHLGQWTGLQRLSLPLASSCDVQQLAGQLTQLTALQELKLRTSCDSPPLLQPLVDVVVGMASLRTFHGSRNFNSQQRSQLQAATQLTELRLR